MEEDEVASFEKSSRWCKAIDDMLDNIENHRVWVDQFERPEKHLNSNWSAFLFALLQEEIFIKTPEGSKQKSPYLKSIKSLYGLNQAPMNCPSVSNACLFIHKEKRSFIFFHVDDLIVVGQPDKFKKLFLARFPNSTAHAPDTLLGMTLNISDEAIELSQPSLIQKAVQLHTATHQDHLNFLKLNLNYQSYTGMLNYLSCRTRPDLAAAVSILLQFNQQPGLTHWKEVLHCWKYLKGTSNLGLLLKPKPGKLLDRITWFTDGTWAEDHKSRISHSGSLAFWKSFKFICNHKKTEEHNHVFYQV
ncbi:hypothetical protein VP01_5683g1 [Puccinia sorghi]|uniref:Reverse transcriptase Ty1/copia-type domain-containing protein n=1 Tax=Puccinia sorghi TaxID=27349 RepID=A0A0L6UKT9_9BASI|nr:hypothetical protein VP01_5683g1 [Puccinia sorghi]